MTGPSRSEARERALLLAYEARQRNVDLHDVVAAGSVQVPDFTAALAGGALGEDYDDWISSHLRGWTLERLPVLDLLVLRMATFELVGGATPTAVVINEAVELAKRYSTEASPRFVNGVLAAIAHDLEGGGQARPGRSCS